MSDQLHYTDHGLLTWEWWGLSPAGNATTMTPWKKSWARGYRFIDVFLVGAGAGGGAGRNKGSEGQAGGGGGGGYSGGIVTARFFVDHLPDVVYFGLPNGGAGGVAAGGATGGYATMCLRPTIVGFAPEFILITSGGSIVGGAVGASGGGAGGTASLAALTTASWSNIALSWTARVGATGGAGGNNAAGNSPPITLAFTGGAGGAGGTLAGFTGGSVVVDPFISVPGGAGGVAPEPGADGLWLRDSPHHSWFSTGGSGGGSNNTAGVVGGRGGNGAPGAGGGGGGTGVAGGGVGGDGGPAYLYLVAS